jgi:hypothetical protein
MTWTLIFHFLGNIWFPSGAPNSGLAWLCSAATRLMLHVLAQVLVCKLDVSPTSMTRSSVPQVSLVVDLAAEINGVPIMRHFVDLFLDTIDTTSYPPESLESLETNCHYGERLSVIVCLFVF